MQPTVYDEGLYDLWVVLLDMRFWLIVVWLMQVIPIWVLHRRVGKSGFWTLLFFIPLAGTLIVLWFLAFSRWPREGSWLERRKLSLEAEQKP